MRASAVLFPPPEKHAELFNKRFPVGTRVNYWIGAKEGTPSGYGVTTDPASVLMDRAVIRVEGYRGAIALTHVEVLL